MQVKDGGNNGKVVVWASEENICQPYGIGKDSVC